jgi:glycosyltransferase involved in cell wall biosynthesis
MRIALFPSAFHPSLGGVEELTRQLGLELQRQGHDVIVITNRWPRDLPKRETIDGLIVHRLPMRFPAASAKSKLSYAATRGLVRRELARIIREHGIEVLHVQCVSTQAHYATWAAKRLRLPLVVTLQGELTMDADGVYQKSERMRRLMRHTLESADVVTACSKHTLDEAEAFLGHPWRQPAHVIYNGVRLADFEGAKPYPHRRPYAFAIGRHVHQKGFDVLLRAWALADRKDLDLILAGDGPERPALERLAAELGISDRVVFFGRANREQTVSLFTGCEFFVLPSRHEPFGIVNVEAMAAGKPIIATRVGGVPEVVCVSEAGRLVPAESPEALGAAISSSRVVRNSGASVRIRESVRRFDWTACTSEYRDSYQAVSRQAVAP